MKTFYKLEDAKEYAEKMGGGWILTGFHGAEYWVTDDEGIILDLRGEEFVDKCESLECWVEDELP